MAKDVVVDEIVKWVKGPKGDLVPIYLPGPTALEAQKRIRLGVYYKVEPLDYPEIHQLCDYNLMFCQVNQNIAKQIIRTRLESDRSNFLSITGNDVRNDMWDKDNEARGQEALGGYKNIPQLFLFFGYNEVPNHKYVSQVTMGLLKQRQLLDLHCWFFSPVSPEDLASQFSTDDFNEIRQMDIEIVKIDLSSKMQLKPTTTMVLNGQTAKTNIVPPPSPRPISRSETSSDRPSASDLTSGKNKKKANKYDKS